MQARVPLWLSASVVGCFLGPFSAVGYALPLAPTGEWEAFAPDDPVGIAYAKKVGEEVARHAGDLERVHRNTNEVDPCLRLPLALWFLIEPSGKVATGWIESSSSWPIEFDRAFEAEIVRWKLPATPDGRYRRIRHFVGLYPSGPPSPALACSARILPAPAGWTDDLREARRGRWLAVCRDRERDEIRPVTLRRRRDPRDMEGTLEAKGCGEPVFFFSGVPESVVGPAVAATVNGQDQSVRPVEERDYDGRKLTVKVPVNRFDVVLGDVAWRFERKTRPDRSWTFILETPNGSVELASGTFEHDWVGLTWAGDLDRDGRPDFVLERNAHIELYLSSAALPGRLVRRVAASQVVPGMDE